MIKVSAVKALPNAAGLKQVECALTAFTFPGGEKHVTVDPNIPDVIELIIDAHLPDAGSVMELLMVTDALKRAYAGRGIILNIPYVPYARQDRVANPGEALSIKVFANLINAQEYRAVNVEDPHSDVMTALIERVHVVDITMSLGWAISLITEQNAGVKPVLVSPDAGARKRTLKLASIFDLNIVFADKVRDTKTGQITGTKIDGGVLTNVPLLIPDDICDGGRTFIELAKVLPTGCAKYLYVTHGIFSKGLDPLLEHFAGVFSRNNWTRDERVLKV